MLPPKFKKLLVSKKEGIVVETRPFGSVEAVMWGAIKELVSGREKFTNRPSRGLDDLGNLILKILIDNNNKELSAKEIITKLIKLAENGSEVVQEVDNEKEQVYWKNKGKEKTSTFRSIENRLTKLRKSI